MVPPLGKRNVCNKCYSNPSKSCQADIAVSASERLAVCTKPAFVVIHFALMVDTERVNMNDPVIILQKRSQADISFSLGVNAARLLSHSCTCQRGWACSDAYLNIFSCAYVMLMLHG